MRKEGVIHESVQQKLRSAAKAVHLVFIACTATLPGGATVTVSRAFSVAVCRSAAVVVRCLRCRRLLILASQCIWRHEGRRPKERHWQSTTALLQRILQVELPVVRKHLQVQQQGSVPQSAIMLPHPQPGGRSRQLQRSWPQLVTRWSFGYTGDRNAVSRVC